MKLFTGLADFVADFIIFYLLILFKYFHFDNFLTFYILHKGRFGACAAKFSFLSFVLKKCIQPKSVRLHQD